MGVTCSKQFLNLLLLLISILSNLTVSQGKYLGHFCINTTDGSYTSSGSIYQRKLSEPLLRNVSWNAHGNGFYLGSVAKNSGRVYATCLCRVYVTPDSCRDCLTVSTNTLPQSCPNYEEAIIYNDDCIFRYSSKNITGIMSDSPEFNIWNPGINVKSQDQFNKTLRNFLESLRHNAAASSGSLGMFASGNTFSPYFGTIYAVVQCTSDLSQDQCSNCLQGAFEKIPHGNKGGWILGPSCNFGYEPYCLFDCTDTGRDVKKRNIVFISSSLPVFFLLMLLSYYIYCKRRKERIEKGKRENQGGDGHQGGNLLVGDPVRTESTQDVPSIKLDIIGSATNKYSNENKLRQRILPGNCKASLPANKRSQSN